MNKRINRKKFLSLKKNFFLQFFLILCLILIIFFAYKYEKKIENLFITKIEKLSTKFEYNLQSYEIEGLNNITKKEIIKIIEPYYNTSIFLLPLKKISNKIYENNWVDEVKLNIDYKNKIIIQIIEFKPIGIYYFNQKKYYFNSKGKIIDYLNLKNNINEEFITFKGTSSTMEAHKLLKILNFFKSDFVLKIKHANFVKKRRWDLLLEKDLLVKLSEKHMEKSIENLIKIFNSLDNDDFENIKVIDMRDYEKVILEYR